MLAPARGLPARALLSSSLHSRMVTRSVQTSAKKYTGMPFDYSNKKTFGLKFLGVCTFGFMLPFIASYWQLRKGKGTAA